MFLGYKMSLLKWQEMAKSKSALGKKINFVHNAITQKKLGEETSQIGLEKMFKPITAKLDDVIASNWSLPGSLRSLPRAQPARKRKAKLKKIDYLPEVDPFEEMDVEGLFDETVPPQPEKQIRPPPPTYEEIVKEVGEDPPAYEDEAPDYAVEPGDEAEQSEAEENANQILDEFDLTNYDVLEKTLNEPNITSAKKINYLNNLLTIATKKTNQLKGYKASFTKKWKKGEITEEQKQWQHQRADRGFQALKEYKNYLNKKMITFQGSGIKKRSRERKKGGGAVSFFSNPKELLQKLKVIIGSILAGNTNVGIRNTGVGILDFLLKEGAINRSQHEKLFKNYFKP